MKRIGRTEVWAVPAGLASAALWVLAIPPFEFAEAAYVAFVPLLLWLYARPGWRTVLLTGFGTGWAAWFAMLIWLRHVTWIGTGALAAILALLFVGWLAVARRWVPRLAGAGFPARVLGFAGLAGLWVVLEWTRAWLFWGFPWAPLALSQWERPVTLQIAAWTGAYGVSFVLVLFNCCIGHTLWRRIRGKPGRGWFGWFSPDLYLALGLVGLCLYVFFRTLPAPEKTAPLLKAGIVQPYIPPALKWDTERERENLAILERQTRFVAGLESDVILWPEAATPWPVAGDPRMRSRVEDLSDRIGKPILMGNLAHERETDRWYNGVFLVRPGDGLADARYIKRELVPFGEFVPAPFGFLEKVVPVGGQFEPGRDAGLIPLEVNGRTLRVGPLVCYEDVFPRLARASVRAGADVLFVATNNAWYGEEGGAVQHAAHSVLRAVENRRPVVRCGNGGWSGWIDASGTVREVLRDGRDSIYFRGGGNLTLAPIPRWRGTTSFYNRHGDWFVALSAALLGPTAWRFRPLRRGVNEGSRAS